MNEVVNAITTALQDAASWGLHQPLWVQILIGILAFRLIHKSADVPLWAAKKLLNGIGKASFIGGEAIEWSVSKLWNGTKAIGRTIKNVTSSKNNTSSEDIAQLVKNCTIGTQDLIKHSIKEQRDLQASSSAALNKLNELEKVLSAKNLAPTTGSTPKPQPKFLYQDEHKAGDVTDVTVPNSNIKIRFRWCPQGEFMMGASPDDKEAFEDEKPQHPVRFDKGFWISETTITQAQYEAVMGINPSLVKGADLPVTNISWQDSVNFYRKLEDLTGMQFDLPTEEEWEYAARAGTTGPRYGELNDIAWYAGNSGGHIHPVGQKKPNAWGLHDMLGNVWQWCRDWYNPKAYSEKVARLNKQ